MATAEAPRIAGPSAPETEAWTQAQRLPCRLSVELAVPGFTVGDLLRLDATAVFDTQVAEGARVPVKVNGQMVGRGEFDVVGERLAVRLVDVL